MDFLLFHSQFSPSSKKLFEDFPALDRKSISVDSDAMRKYTKKLGIVCVPTLIVLLNNRIIDRVIGYDAIYQWLVTSIYRINHLQPQALEDEQVQVPLSNPEPIDVQTTNREPINATVNVTDIEAVTPLDDLVLEDTEGDSQLDSPIVQTGQSLNTMMLAEAMKKERDNNIGLPANKKMFPH